MTTSSGASMLPWLPADYAGLARLPIDLAVEGSLLLSRLVADECESGAQGLREAVARGDVVAALGFDAVAGAAFHAGRFELTLELIDLYRLAPETPAEPVVEVLLDIKEFAALAALGEHADAQARAAHLLRTTSATAVAAIVWSGLAILHAWRGEVLDLQRCVREFEALSWDDPRLVETRLGSDSLVRFALASQGGDPAVLRSQLLQTLWRRAQPLRALQASAHDVGRSLASTGQIFELTDRRQRVLTLLGEGATNTTIARRLAVAPRTVQQDVSALKEIFAVTSRAALVAASGVRRPGSAALTPRQRRVAALVQSGYTTAGIAAELGISPRTVERHTAAVRERLGVLSRAELAAYALDGSPSGEAS